MEKIGSINKNMYLSIAVTAIAILIVLAFLSGCGRHYKRRYPHGGRGGGGCHFIETGQPAPYQHQQN